MKNTIKLLITIAIIASISIACAGGPKAGGGMTLDKALAEAAGRIDERIEAGAKMALLNFNSPTTRFSEYVLNELEANILDYGKILIIDRKELDLVRGELAFQMGGEVSDRSMQELGQMLGAKYVVSGSLTEITGSNRLVIRVLVVETAAVAAQYRADIANDSRVQALLQGGRSGGATSSGGTTTAARPSVQASAPAAPAPVAVANGTYTFNPRPRGIQRGMPATVYVHQIVVHGRYMNILFADRPAGEGASGVPYFSSSHIQDLDGTRRTFSPTNEQWQGSYWAVTFEGVQTRRFMLNHPNENMVIEEIDLSKADYRP